MKRGILANYIESQINADFDVLEDALKRPAIWEGSDMALDALTRIREALALAVATVKASNTESSRDA